MAVLKVIEILGNSTVSFEDAVQNVVEEDMQVSVKDNQVTEYRVNTKVSFGIMQG